MQQQLTAHQETIRQQEQSISEYKAAMHSSETELKTQLEQQIQNRENTEAKCQETYVQLEETNKQKIELENSLGELEEQLTQC